MSAPHRWLTRPKFIPWSYCAHCGLVNLRNKLTQKAANKACPSAEEK